MKNFKVRIEPFGSWVYAIEDKMTITLNREETRLDTLYL